MTSSRKYAVDLDGKRHTAEVGVDGPVLEISIDAGAKAPTTCLPVLGGRALAITIGGHRRVVHLSGADTRGHLRATLDGRPYNLTVIDELRAQALAGPGAAAGSGTLTADIPGLVVDIRVKPGQEVRQGEPLIVVEAMKMQNELTAGIPGTVRRVAVAVGQPVNPGDVLVVISPAPGDGAV